MNIYIYMGLWWPPAASYNCAQVRHHSPAGTFARVPGTCLRWSPTPPGPRWSPAYRYIDIYIYINRSFASVQMCHTHTHFHTQRLLHTEAFTHRSFYTEAHTHRRFYTQTLLHTDTFTHRRFYTSVDISRAKCCNYCVGVQLIVPFTTAIQLLSDHARYTKVVTIQR